MNTQEFLERILPRQGVYYAAYFPNKDNLFCCHKACFSIPELASTLLNLDKRYYAVFHACASFKQASIVGPNGKKKPYRVAKNCQSVRAFWIDLDVGEKKAKEGKGYASQKEAIQALAAFCKKYKLPTPMLVSSGYGVHAYFTLDQDIDGAEWMSTAAILKALLNSEKVLADPSRTADVASILRPVGTANKKRGASMPVYVITPGTANVSYTRFKAVLMTAAKNLSLNVRKPSGMADDFTAEPEDPSVKKLWDSDYVRDLSIKADADRCCQGCEQMRIMRETKGDVSYDTLQNVIGVLRHCVDGYRIACEWTANRHEKHDQGVEAVQRLWNTLSAPFATSCATFESNNPEPCLRCPNRGKVFNPANLGRLSDAQLLSMELLHNADSRDRIEQPVGASATAEVSSVTPEAGEFGTATASESEVEGIQGFYWGGDDVGMVRVVEGKKNSQSTTRVFCHRQLKIIDRTTDEDGKESFIFTVKDPKTKKWKDFTLTGTQCAPGDLIKNLASYGVATAVDQLAESDMKAYVKAQIANIQRKVEATPIVSHFGWQNDGSFVVGPRMYCKGQKTPSIVLLGDDASKNKRLFPEPRGTVSAYAAALNAVYSQAGMEPLQYAICSVWGSILVQLCNAEYKGIPVALTGTESGMGKTTAARAALYAFGDSDAMLTNGFEGSTQYALTKRLSTLQNLPVFLDEFTDGTDSAYSKLLYSLANGAERDRLNRDASSKERLHWRSQSFITGNTSITDLLSADNANRSAQQMRIFEISVDEFEKQIPKFKDPSFVPSMVAQMGENMGMAGEALIQYVVDNLPAIKASLASVVDPNKNSDCCGTLFTESQARNLRYHIACTLVAAEIMRELGVITFDVPKLRAFALSYAQRIVTDTLSKRLHPIDIILTIMDANSAWSVVTPHFGDTVESVAKTPLDKLIKYRVVQTVKATPLNRYDNTVLIRCKLVKDWLTANRQGTQRALENGLGKTVLGKEKLLLGKGLVDIPGNRAWCYILDLKDIYPDLYGATK